MFVWLIIVVGLFGMFSFFMCCGVLFIRWWVYFLNLFCGWKCWLVDWDGWVGVVINDRMGLILNVNYFVLDYL